MEKGLWRPGWGHRHGPIRDLARAGREMDDLFDRLFHHGPTAWGGMKPAAWGPAVDIIDRKNEVILRADLPGLDQKDIEVTVQEGVLTLRGERKEEQETKEDDYYCCERTTGAFSRSLTLPPGVDPEKVEGSFKKGVLEIRVPKTKGAIKKKVNIQAE